MAARADCPECPGRMRRVFATLTGAHLATLNRDRVTYTYRRGQVLFHEGTAALAFYCIHSGRLKLYKVERHDDEVVVGTCESGDLIGLDTILAHETHGVTAEALEDSVVCTIPRETLLGLIQVCPRLSLGVITQMARRHRLADEQFVERTREHVAERTARFILRMSEEQKDGSPAGTRVAISVRREEMAQLIGTTPETLSRTLHRLALDGLIRIGKSELRILDMPALRRLGGLGA